MLNPDDVALKRAGGVVGLVGIGLMFASLPMAPPWPEPPVSSSGIVDYFTQHRQGLLAQVYTSSAGVLFLVVWAGVLASLLYSRGSRVAGPSVLGAMVLFTGGFFMTWLPWLVIVFRHTDNLETAKVLYDLGLIGQFVSVAFPLMLLFCALGAGVLRSAVLPKWLGYLALPIVGVNVVLGTCMET